MGAYTNNLFKKNRKKHPSQINVLEPDTGVKVQSNVRLISCAIMRENILHKGFKSHAELRRSLGDENPYQHTKGDREGFYTSDNRFVGRHEAMIVGQRAGQCQYMERELLSSDINW